MNLHTTPPRTSTQCFHVPRQLFRTVFRRVLAALLIATLAPVAPLMAQVAAVAAAPQSLHITILDGEDAINNIRERTAREPIVQVEDENHKPVAGALVLFAIQGGPNGASASFNGLNTLSVTTDAEGKAVAHGLKPNGSEGSYSIAVSATVGTLVATTIIKQLNSLGAGGGGAGTPANPVQPATSTGTTGTTSTGTTSTGTTGTTSTGVSSSSSGASSTGVTSTGVASKGTLSTIAHGSKLTTLLKSPWLFSAVGVVVVTVAVRTTVVGGKSPTSITPGTGTVGAP